MNKFSYFIHSIKEGWCTMNKDKNKNSTDNKQAKNDYDDGNIPEIDLPMDIIPDKVPRKDGPGGESGD